MYSVTGRVTWTLLYVSTFSSFSVDEFLHASTLQNGLRIQACCSTFIPKADYVHSTYHNVRSGHVLFFLLLLSFSGWENLDVLCALLAGLWCW